MNAEKFDLESIRNRLIEGIKLSGQPSYARRAPSSKGEAVVREVVADLRNYLKATPADERAWRLLSQAEEILLDYEQAIDSLQRAINLSGQRDKKDIKRLARLKDYQQQWRALPLNPMELQELGKYLENRLAGTVGSRDLKFTKEWLLQHGFNNIEEIIEALGERGAYSDFQVLYNVVRG